MRSVLVVQAYVPDYRRPLFERVVDAFASLDIRCRVLLTGETERGQADRDDRADTARWSKDVSGRKIVVANHLLRISSQRKHWAKADAVVFPLAGSWLDVYRALLTRDRPKVALWGHVAPYTRPGVGLDLSLERWQMRRADHVFAYTEEGRRFAIRAGIDPDRVTALGNTIDVAGLEAARAALTSADIASFRTAHHIENGPVFAVLGALDAPKRVDFLRRALDELWARDTSARVLVAGEGREAALLDAARVRGQIVRLGRVDDVSKALIGSTATALLNPGRIGLAAVDALTMRIPLVTTSVARHGPEADYLVRGESVFVAPDDPPGFVSTLLSLGTAPLPRASGLPTIEEMANHFVEGTISMFD